MAGILIIAHAPLASALKAVAAHVYPECVQPVGALDIEADADGEEAETQAREMLARVATPEALILTDVFGATPCNLALRLADGVNVRVVAGVNVPMLWRTVCYAAEPIETLVLRALAGAAQGVMQVVPTRSLTSAPSTAP